MIKMEETETPAPDMPDTPDEENPDDDKTTGGGAG